MSSLPKASFDRDRREMLRSLADCGPLEQEETVIHNAAEICSLARDSDARCEFI